MIRPQPPRALYIHVPFCVSVCPYCDFVVYGGKRARGPANQVGVFVRAVEAEIALRADLADDAFPKRPPLHTVYFGGGTPSLLAPAAVGRLLELVDRRFGLDRSAEVTLEANPGAGDRGDLAAFRAAGVTRLSIGAQSLDDRDLRALGRRHDAAAVRDAVREARMAGFDDVSIDLLYDVPGQSVESWGATIESAIALDTDHVSAYALTLPDVTPDATAETTDHLAPSTGAQRWRQRARRRQDDDRAADMYALADARLSAAGLRWYEISNWARRGHESRHNLAYWTGAAYEAVGPGAHSFDGALTRRWNGPRLDAYLTALCPPDRRSPRLPPGGQEIGDPASARTDRLVLGLRLACGVATRDPHTGRHAAALEWARRHRLVEEAPDALRLTLTGRLLSNELFARLI